MSNRENVLEGARLIRVFLPELVGADWNVLDKKLADLLAAASHDRKVDNQILQAVAEDDRARRWMRDFLRIKQSTEGRSDDSEIRLFLSRSFSSLLGDPRPVPAARFECPQGDFVWYEPTIGATPPKCPTHEVELARSNKK